MDVLYTYTHLYGTYTHLDIRVSLLLEHAADGLNNVGRKVEIAVEPAVVLVIRHQDLGLGFRLWFS